MRADDRILWISPETDAAIGGRSRLVASLRGFDFFHVCPGCVVIAHTTSRESLDPMALGECRYCKEALT